MGVFKSLKMSDTTSMTITEPRLFEDSQAEEPSMSDETRARLIAEAAGNQGIHAAEVAAEREDNGVQADLGGRGTDQLPEEPVSWELSEKTKEIGRKGIAEARAVLEDIPRRPDNTQ